jgi:hypothetical protein
MEIFQPVCSAYSWIQGRKGLLSKSRFLLNCGEIFLVYETEASRPRSQNPAIAPTLKQIIADTASYITAIKYILYCPPICNCVSLEVPYLNISCISHTSILYVLSVLVYSTCPVIFYVCYLSCRILRVPTYTLTFCATCPLILYCATCHLMFTSFINN